MNKMTLQLPDLPKKHTWVRDGFVHESNNFVRLTIVKKFGFMYRKAVEGDWFAISVDSEPQDISDQIMMQCDLLMIQLPDKIHVAIEVSDEEF